MLHLKLPKNKTAVACDRAGQVQSRAAEAMRLAYKAEVEAWRKTRPVYVTTEWPPLMSPIAQGHAAAAKRLIGMADACAFSTGDVYVSVELWNEIKGYYDV